MECQKAIDLLSDYLEGAISEDARAHLQSHFKDCPPCLEFFESYRKTSTLCRKSLMKTAPSDVVDRLKTFLRANCKGSNKP